MRKASLVWAKSRAGGSSKCLRGRPPPPAAAPIRPALEQVVVVDRPVLDLDFKAHGCSLNRRLPVVNGVTLAAMAVSFADWSWHEFRQRLGTRPVVIGFDRRRRHEAIGR